jgi:hypothetical protein
MAQNVPTLPSAMVPVGADRAPARWVVLTHAALGILLGLAMGSLIIGHLADYGSQGPLVQQMLALGDSRGSGDSLQAVAADSGSQLLRFGGLALATGAALALLYGAAAGLATGGRARTASQAVRIGLWLALALALLALLPLDGAPFALGYAGTGSADPAALDWHPALRAVAFAAAAGLLVSGILLRRTSATAAVAR